MSNQVTIATSALYLDPDSVIEQIKGLLRRTTGTFEALTFEIKDFKRCSACEKEARREWAELDEHTCLELMECNLSVQELETIMTTIPEEPNHAK